MSLPTAVPASPIEPVPATTPVSDAHRRLQVAPMMELTDRHYRVLARLLSRHTLLWTEMLTARAVVHGDRDHLLGHDAVDGPVVLQLGGSEPAIMREAARIGAEHGYGEININVGCPSDRVKAGRFGACLMAEPELVAELVAQMRAAVDVPVSVKCRLGIDRDDSFEALERFVAHIVDAGCRQVIVHARKAWLDGLSPKENRSVPPLRYEFVHRLKALYPALHVSINGGIDDWSSIEEQLRRVDGVMIGRAGYYRPTLLAEADARLFADLGAGIDQGTDTAALARVARAYAAYMRVQAGRGVRIASMSRHLIALVQDRPGARQWRRRLSEGAPKASDAVALVEQALAAIEGDVEAGTGNGPGGTITDLARSA